MKKQKKAISPVIASVLLVSMAIILALIIFLWAKSFIGENLVKNKEVIENSCPSIVFDADITGGELLVGNNGNVALYGVAIKKASEGKEELCYPFEGETTPTIRSGESRALIISDKCTDLNLATGDSISVIPVILGETDSGDRMYYTCGDEFGKEVIIGE